MTERTRINFSVPAIPIAQPRQRQRIINGKGGKSFASNYTPGKHPVNDFKAGVRMAACQAYQGAPLTGPLGVVVLLVFPRAKQQIWKTKPMPRLPHTKKPDFDNCAKAVLDALNGLLFMDDSQVCCAHIEKCIAAGDEQPHVQVTIETLAIESEATPCT